MMKRFSGLLAAVLLVGCSQADALSGVIRNRGFYIYDGVGAPEVLVLGTSLGLHQTVEPGGSDETVLLNRQTISVGSGLLSLNTTPVTAVAAPGANKANIFEGAELYWDYVTAACGGVADNEDLVFKYTNGSGLIVSPLIETHDFIDAASDQLRNVGPLTTNSAGVINLRPAANAAIVLQLANGNVTSCVGSLRVRTYYRVVPTTF